MKVCQVSTKAFSSAFYRKTFLLLFFTVIIPCFPPTPPLLIWPETTKIITLPFYSLPTFFCILFHIFVLFKTLSLFCFVHFLKFNINIVKFLLTHFKSYFIILSYMSNTFSLMFRILFFYTTTHLEQGEGLRILSCSQETDLKSSLFILTV